MNSQELLDALRTACSKGDKNAAHAADEAILKSGLHWVAIYRYDGFWATNTDFIINKVKYNVNDKSFPSFWRIGKYDELFRN